MAKKVKIDKFGIQSGTTNTVYITWNWSKSNTDHYAVRWYYYTGDGVRFVGDSTTTNNKQSTYTPPSNAESISVTIKPVSKKHKVNGKETSYWTADWSTAKKYYLKNAPPSVPSTPTVTIDRYRLTASLTNIQDLNAKQIEFHIAWVDLSNKSVKHTVTIVKNDAVYTYTVNANARFKVRARAIKGDLKSDWSDYSGAVTSAPVAPDTFTEYRATSKTSVFLRWNNVVTAKTYDIEYTTNRRYFGGSDGTTTITGIEDTTPIYPDGLLHPEKITKTSYEKTGLETGHEYFFRIRANNDTGTSDWSSAVSVVLGKAPAAPTTWSSTTTVKVGETLKFYWVHNAEDGSSQVKAELEMDVDGTVSVETIVNSTDEDEKDKTSEYAVDTSKYNEGATIKWRVRTCGVTDEYGDWSVQRVVDVFAPPSLAIQLTDAAGAENAGIINVLPCTLTGTAGPASQKPIGYYVSISPDVEYETIDFIGNPKVVQAGESIFSKNVDTSEDLSLTLSAGNITLENNVKYTCEVTVTMNSGLTATDSTSFTINWDDDIYEPDAEISIDQETYTASIRPYCVDESETQVSGVLLSLYRREFDGSFTEIATGLDNMANTFVTDPHPALDYARYRVVAISENTGTISYSDIPAYPVGGIAIIVQWDESWSSFDVTDSDELAEQSWTGSMLKLPYNIDVSDKHKSDVSLVEYIGRKHPVTYYGTQLGESSTWSLDIPKNDKDTLYALRRLAIWMGDVYVREPSGSGYWANVTVSFSQKHKEVVIPVTLELTRVEGGM